MLNKHNNWQLPDEDIAVAVAMGTPTQRRALQYDATNIFIVRLVGEDDRSSLPAGGVTVIRTTQKEIVTISSDSVERIFHNVRRTADWPDVDILPPMLQELKDGWSSIEFHKTGVEGSEAGSTGGCQWVRGRVGFDSLATHGASSLDHLNLVVTSGVVASVTDIGPVREHTPPQG